MILTVNRPTPFRVVLRRPSGPREGSRTKTRFIIRARRLICRVDSRLPISSSELANTTGTTLGILVAETGTCVCVAEGEVIVDDLLTDREDAAVGAEMNLFVFDSGAPPVELPFDDSPDEEHTRHVLDLAEFADA